MGLLHLSSDFELLNFLVAEENEAEEEEGEKKEEEEKEEEKEEESISVGEVLLPPSPLEYPVKEISQLFNTINELNLDIHLLSILTIRQEKEEEDGKGEDAEKHSSTLVTAGVYLIIRFNSFLIETDVRIVLSFISILTMFISGVMTNFENKIIAYYLLLVHAIFKSMLFMAAGAVIHLIKNTQDIRLLGNLNEVIPYVIIRLISRMAVRGVPFMAGFYRKDLIIEIIYGRRELNIFMFVLIIMSLSLTVSYSLRFFYYLFFNRRLKFYSYIYV
ncbi:NADH-ubiquinone oxidoreductase chain 5 [Atta colombica]|uniref:NADH:ubiquinone reductase (H(+)-translocating) n=1 Tax=Atta colombica TaxID=520822 RepID=A0A151HZL5_9HYME|nr:NADH-ubiquinone oxidoreductase chain 5 [Atta colombica]